MKPNNRFFAFVGFQELEAFFAVLETVFSQDYRTSRLLENREITLYVWITVRIVHSQTMTGEPEAGLFIQAVGQFVTSRLAFASIGAPAGGIVPAVTLAGGIHVDGHQEDIAFAQSVAPAVRPVASGAEANVIFLRHQQFSVVAKVFTVGHDGTGNFPCPGIFPESAIRGALTGRVHSVTIVNQDFHVALYYCFVCYPRMRVLRDCRFEGNPRAFGSGHGRYAR